MNTWRFSVIKLNSSRGCSILKLGRAVRLRHHCRKRLFRQCLKNSWLPGFRCTCVNEFCRKTNEFRQTQPKNVQNKKLYALHKDCSDPQTETLSDAENHQMYYKNEVVIPYPSIQNHLSQLHNLPPKMPMVDGLATVTDMPLKMQIKYHIYVFPCRSFGPSNCFTNL